MTKATEFAPEEAGFLYDLPFIVAGTSLAVIHVSAFKAIKTAVSFYSIVRDTSKQFPDNECIQTIFAHKDVQQGHNELIEKHQANGKDAAVSIRNGMCEQALGILNGKCSEQETEEYKHWLLSIASEVMHKAQSHGFLGLGKERAEAEIAQALQDFSLVLQLPQ
ncbi:MAG: hypothetical protein ACREBW_02825 [Candidatus Micrarchaeaceae archaeon]